MARISWEQTFYKKPAVESYQTANMDDDSEKDSELITPSENDLLFKRVIVGTCSDGVEGDDMDHKSLADGYVTPHQNLMCHISYMATSGPKCGQLLSSKAIPTPWIGRLASNSIHHTFIGRGTLRQHHI